MANTDSSKRIESLLQFGNIIFVIAIYLYFIGYIFNYWFLRYFGIAFQSVDVQFHHMFIYSYSTIFTWRIFYTLHGGVFFIISICVIWLSFFCPKCIRVKKNIKNIILTIFLISLIPFSYLLARQEGTWNAKEIQKGSSKTINFTFKKDAFARYPEEFITANDKNKLRIVVTTKDRFYVIHQLDEGTGKLPGLVYDIPRADVLLTRIIAYPQ